MYKNFLTFLSQIAMAMRRVPLKMCIFCNAVCSVHVHKNMKLT